MKRPLILHPFFIGMFPVLSLFARNINELRASIVVVPLAAVLGFVLLMYLLLTLARIPRQKAGALTSFVVVLLFSFGHVTRALDHYLESRSFLGRMIESPVFSVYIAWTALFIAGFIWIRGTTSGLDGLTKFANVLGLSLVAITMTQIAYAELVGRHTLRIDRLAGLESTGRAGGNSQSLPDIYYLVLDAYARNDVLETVYGYDNSSFTDSLKQKGFFVADKARANYPQTALSLASTLNMDYLDELLAGINRDSDNRRILRELIAGSRVLVFLRDHGYRTVAFSSGFDATELKSADYYVVNPYGMDEFQSVLLESTPLPLLREIVFRGGPYDHHREGILHTLHKLPELARLGGPKFVFAHVLAPHPPFVFGRHGESVQPNEQFTLWDGPRPAESIPVSQEQYRAGYTHQLEFISKKVLETVDAILSNSQRKPIIIIQGDHGPRLRMNWEDPQETDHRETLSILNAYLLPGGSADLYAGITPVNTFRLIFNHYFGTHLKPLPDRSFFASWLHPYRFLDVTCRIESCEERPAPGPAPGP
jgi:Sulfatase